MTLICSMGLKYLIHGYKYHCTAGKQKLLQIKVIRKLSYSRYTNILRRNYCEVSGLGSFFTAFHTECSRRVEAWVSVIYTIIIIIEYSMCDRGL